MKYFLSALALTFVFEASLAGNAHSEPPVLNLKTLGLPTGGDDTAALNAAFSKAKSAGEDIYAPCGVYRHSGDIFIDGIQLKGDGSCSDFRSMTKSTGRLFIALVLTGEKPSLQNIKTSTEWNLGRQGNNDSAAVYIHKAENFSVSHIEVDGSASVGIFTVSSHTGKVMDNVVHSSLADGISTSGASSGIQVTGNTVYKCGDDCISIDSYMNDGGPSEHVTITGNQVRDGKARGFAVAGGRDVEISHNKADNMNNAAFIVLNDAGFSTFGGHNITIKDNEANTVNTGVVIYGHAKDVTEDVVFANNIIRNISFQGANIGGDGGEAQATRRITLSHNTFEGLENGKGSYGMYINAVDVTVENNTIHNFPLHGIAVGSGGSGYAKITGNHIEQVGTAAPGSYDAINLEKTGFSVLTLSNNTETDGTSHVRNLITLNDPASVAVLSGNHGDNMNIADLSHKRN